MLFLPPLKVRHGEGFQKSRRFRRGGLLENTLRHCHAAMFSACGGSSLCARPSLGSARALSCFSALALLRSRWFGVVGYRWIRKAD